MLLLLFLTSTIVLIVVQNAVQLLIGFKELPRSTRVSVISYCFMTRKNIILFNVFCYQEQVTLGMASLSKLGMFGATLEIVLIIYLVATSAVGLFTSSLMQRVRPVPSATPLSLIILHCALLLLLSSALPLLSRILGNLSIIFLLGLLCSKIN